MICSPLLTKQYFPHQRRLAFTNRETRGRLCFLSWSQKNSTVLREPKFGPPPPPHTVKNSWICPCNQLATHIRSDQLGRIFLLQRTTNHWGASGDSINSKWLWLHCRNFGTWIASRGPSIFLDEPTCRGRSKGHCPQGRYFEALKNAHKNEMFVLAIIIISLQ